MERVLEVSLSAATNMYQNKDYFLNYFNLKRILIQIIQ